MKSRLLLIPAIAVALTFTACSSSATTAPPEENPAEEIVEEEATETPSEDGGGLSAEVEAGILEGFPGGITESSPLFAVTEYEDLGADTVRVYVQENLDDQERDEIGRQVFTMSMVDELRVVVVRDASGIDSNHYR